MVTQKSIVARIETLVRALSDIHPMERQTAISELARIGKPAIPALLRLLRSDQTHLRWAACRALAKIADPQTTEALVNELADEDQVIRIPAAMGLVALQRQGIRRLLEELTRPERVEAIMHEAYPVLYELSRSTWGQPLRRVLLAITGPAPQTEVPRAAQIALRVLGDGQPVI